MTLATFDLPAGRFTLRRAVAGDVTAIVALLAADQVAAVHESVDESTLPLYLRAFETIDANDSQLLVVAVDNAGAVIATQQLTYIPGLSRRGSTRLQIEAVRVDERLRSGGLGGAMITWAIDQAKVNGCGLVQLTSDSARESAHRFYTRLGFSASHVGFKLRLI